MSEGPVKKKLTHGKKKEEPDGLDTTSSQSMVFTTQGCMETEK